MTYVLKLLVKAQFKKKNAFWFGHKNIDRKGPSDLVLNCVTHYPNYPNYPNYPSQLVYARPIQSQNLTHFHTGFQITTLG